jgi:hypothetical protein
VLKLSIYFLLALVVSGCTTSNHNLNDGPNPLGGGFSDNQISEGLFWIVAQTNFAPWSDFEAARKIFNSRATNLCQSDNFFPMRIMEKEFEHIPRDLPPKYIISQVSGYVVCESTNYTFEEIEGLIRQSTSLDV